MKIPSANLQAFYVLARERNFTNSAKKIGISQPAFSQRISTLESFFETTLFIREKANIELTKSGEKLLSYCKTISQIEDELLLSFSSSTDHSNELRGQIRIGGFSSVLRSLVIPALSSLLTGNSKLSIQTFTGELSDIPDWLKRSKIDFAIHNKQFNQSNFESLFLGYEHNVLVSSRKFPKVSTYLDHDEKDVTTSSYFKLLKKKHPQNIRYLDDVYGLLDGVKMGLGKAVLPIHLLDSKDLKIENPKTILKVPVYLVYHKAPYYTQLQKAVICELQKKLSKNLLS